jgi:transposase, IS30 family
MPGKRLSREERRFIEAARSSGLSCRAIGAELGRPHTTISREVSRNKLVHNGAYLWRPAQHFSERRARRPKPFKLERHRRLALQVERLLTRKWSPEQISVRLREEHPDDPRWWVSAEAIYHSLQVEGHGGLRSELARHLKLQRSTRKTGTGPGRLTDTIHISQRPPEAAGRAVPGHWEGDLILGAKGTHSQVGILTERATRFTLLFALPQDRTAPTVRDALVKIVATIPKQLRRSLTWDNGKEMADHINFSAATNLNVYFCDPGRPWQRGTVENTIGLLRAYLPKGEDLSPYRQADLAHIAEMLNERPREILGWKSPARAYAELLAVQ